jgi:hypothetical protein
MLRLTTLLVCFLLLSACQSAVPPSAAPTPSGNLYAPQPGDSLLERASFYLDEQATSVTTLESAPLQFMLNLKGNLPTPCHQPRVVVHAPDAANRIIVEAYTLLDPNKMCVQVIDKFEANIPLGSFPHGHYTIWINEIMIGEIDA